MVLEEAEQVARRVLHRLAAAAGPHAGDERHGVQAGERLGEAAVADELAVGRGVVVGGLREERGGQGVEALDRAQHPDELAVEQLAGTGHEALQAPPAGVLGAGGLVADAHRHLGVAGLHAELGEQPAQQRVGAVVVHDEAAVDAQVAVEGRHGVGVRVAAEPRLGLEQGDPVGPAQHVGRGEPRDAGADHGDPLRAAGGHARGERCHARHRRTVRSALSKLCRMLCHMFVKPATSVYRDAREGFGTADDADW